MSFPQYARGSHSIPAGVDHDTVSGLALPFAPSQVFSSIKRQTGNLLLTPVVRTLTISSDGFDYDFDGVTDNGSYVLDYLLLNKGTQFQTSTIPGAPSAFQGIDPVLGPPFAPIDYQLFITPILPPDSFIRPPGAPAHLYWTVPDLAAFAYSRIVKFPDSLGNYSFWYSNSSAANSAVFGGNYLGDQETPPPAQIWIPATGYLWATQPLGTIPTNPGWPIAGASVFKGLILFNNGTNPGTFALDYPWSSAPADDIHHFELFRGTNGVDFPDATNTLIPGHALDPSRPNTIDDPANRLATTDYWYKMFGVSVNGLRFPYNTSGLLHPYRMSINRTAGVTLFTWQAPNVANFP